MDALTSPRLAQLCLASFPRGQRAHPLQEEKCYRDGIFFYHLGCHQWVSGAEHTPPGTPGESPLCFYPRGS